MGCSMKCFINLQLTDSSELVILGRAYMRSGAPSKMEWPLHKNGGPCDPLPSLSLFVFPDFGLSGLGFEFHICAGETVHLMGTWKYSRSGISITFRTVRRSSVEIML